MNNLLEAQGGSAPLKSGQEVALLADYQHHELINDHMVSEP